MLSDDFDNEIAQSIECIDTLASFDYLPPLKSPQYINELNSIRSKGPEKINLYQRPDSPHHNQLISRTPPPLPLRQDSVKSRGATNGRLGHRQPSTESVPPSPTYANTDLFQTFRRAPEGRFFNDSTAKLEAPDILSSTVLSRQDSDYSTLSHYRRPDVGDRKPPPGKGPFRKSFSVRGIDSRSMGSRDCNWSSSDISRDTRNGFNFSSSDISDISSTESYGRIHHNASTELLYVVNRPQNGAPRRYATLAHPVKHHPMGKSTGSLNENRLREDEILDCKIGCQTTLRSKPRIPWYELAIKKENRQSCPPLQVIELLLFDFYPIFSVNLTQRRN